MVTHWRYIRMHFKWICNWIVSKNLIVMMVKSQNKTYLFVFFLTLIASTFLIFTKTRKDYLNVINTLFRISCLCLHLLLLLLFSIVLWINECTSKCLISFKMNHLNRRNFSIKFFIFSTLPTFSAIFFALKFLIL